MNAVVVTTQENAVEVAALLQLKQGWNMNMWMNLPAVEVVVAGMGCALVAVDTGIDYENHKKGRKQHQVWQYSV